MGRGRRGPVDQSQKKQNISKYPRDRRKQVVALWNANDDKILFLPTDVVDKMKWMNPQEVAYILLSKEM